MVGAADSRRQLATYLATRLVAVKGVGMAQFRLMTWNVENLFDVGDDDGPKTQTQFAAKIESLRAVIDAQQPHVLTLQEVGSESALGKLQAALEHKLPHRAVA